MKRHQPSFRQFWDDFFGPFRKLPSPNVDPAWQRVLDRLPDAPDDLAVEQRAVSRPRLGLRFVVAAALIMTVAIGVYAYRVQRASLRQVVPPSAQSPSVSVKAPATAPQAAAATLESAKPGVAPTREEILRGAAAQIAAAQSTDAGGARPKFAAASLRPVPISPLLVNGFNCLGIDGLLGQRPGVQPIPSPITGAPTAVRGRCVGDVVSPSEMVHLAYSRSSISPFTPLSARTGMPRSLELSYFQINAVADDPARVTKGELKLMLQTFLEDRFKARVHLETREVDGYVLTIAKSGIKFKETSDDESCSNRPRPLRVSGKCKMEALTTRIELTLDGRTSLLDYVPIADKTGLAGLYDMNFELEEISFGGPAGVRGAGGGTSQARQFTTPIAKALEDQLGLHLERGKVPVEFVVVDHIEPPTEN